MSLFLSLFFLQDSFGEDAEHQLYADFRPVETEPEPAFYIHVVQKTKST